MDSTWITKQVTFWGHNFLEGSDQNKIVEAPNVLNKNTFVTTTILRRYKKAPDSTVKINQFLLL